MRLTDDPRPLALTKPDVSWTKEVQDVMGKALQRKRDDRYRSAADFGNALYVAVEHMPKQAPAAATQMIGAMDGATAVLSAPPPTRIDASAPSAVPITAPSPAPVAPAPVASSKKSLVPMIGGLGALAAAIVAGFFILTKDGPGTAKADTTSAPPVAANVPPGTVPQPPVQQAVGSQTSSKSTQTPTPLSKPLNANSPPAGSTTQPANTAEVDIGARLPALYKESSEDATAAAALKEAEALSARAVRTSDLIGLGVVKAQAHGILGHPNKVSCDILDAIKERGANTIWNDKIQFLLQQSC